MRCRRQDESGRSLLVTIRWIDNEREDKKHTYFVRIRSNGASMSPVATAAAIATPREAHG